MIGWLARFACRHAWQTIEVLAGVEVPPLPERAVLRQRCGLCLRWRMRFDDGTDVRVDIRSALRLLELEGLLRFRPYDVGRGFADPDAEPTLVLDPVESRHVQAEWLER